jgi:hypothetical protein
LYHNKPNPSIETCVKKVSLNLKAIVNQFDKAIYD